MVRLPRSHVMAFLLVFEEKWKTKIPMCGTSYVEWLNHFKHASSELLGWVCADGAIERLKKGWHCEKACFTRMDMLLFAISTINGIKTWTKHQILV